MKRFWDKVNKKGDCWNWTASFRKAGYGAFKYKGKVISAHRMSFIIKHEYIPAGKWVLHRCDNRKCVNPAHLFLGNASDNMQDCANKNRLYSQNIPPKHGTQNLYCKGCRCEDCKRAHNINNREWRKRKALNR